MRLETKQITLTAAFLAICIASQFLKNTSVYITGTIINTALILTTVYCGLICGIILSVITPVTAFFITGSPVMSAVPALFPCIMLGNTVLVVVVRLLKNTFWKKLSYLIAMAIGSIAKGMVMGLLIAVLVLPNFLPEKMKPMLKTLQIQFSLTQLITALMGSVFAFLIIRLLGRKIDLD